MSVVITGDMEKYAQSVQDELRALLRELCVIPAFSNHELARM